MQKTSIHQPTLLVNVKTIEKNLNVEIYGDNLHSITY